MPSDLPIVSRTIEAAPKDYTVPGAQEIVPVSVTAAIDGSGAASSFLPCLQLLAPDGTVMWTAPTPASLAAGASADVSWWARAGSAATTATSSALPYLFVRYLSPAGLASSSSLSGVNLQPGTSGVHYGTSDSSILDLTDTGSGTYGLTFNANGLYLVFASASIDFTASPAAGAVAEIGLTGTNWTVAGNDTELIVATIGGGAWGGEPSRVCIFNLPASQVTPPSYSVFEVGQNSTHTSQRYAAAIYAVQMNSTGNSNF